MQRFGDGRDWFFEKRMGLFVHWGIYAIPAWQEQVQYRKRIPRRDYEQLMHQFDPARFDPEQWLDTAQDCGFEYLTLTTKHIDGFCMWDTRQTDYRITNTPYGRDTLRLLADACHRRQFPLCLYYSVVDEHHPNYPNQNRPYELEEPDPGDEPDLDRYLEYLRKQVHELCTEYGEIHGFWWDGNVLGWRDPSIMQMIRSLQPRAVINNRGPGDGDFTTPERDWDTPGDEVLEFDRPTEACQSVGHESWGYKEDEDYYADAYLVQSIDRILARGGSYLLNVGPRADGVLPDEGVRIMREVGRWRRAVGEAFDGARPASRLTSNRDVLLTRKGNDLYVHLCKPPATDAVILAPLDVLPRRAVVLNDGSEVEARVDLVATLYRDRRSYLRIRRLPVNKPGLHAIIVKLEFDRLPDTPPAAAAASAA